MEEYSGAAQDKEVIGVRRSEKSFSFHYFFRHCRLPEPAATEN